VPPRRAIKGLIDLPEPAFKGIHSDGLSQTDIGDNGGIHKKTGPDVSPSPRDLYTSRQVNLKSEAR